MLRRTTVQQSEILDVQEIIKKKQTTVRKINKGLPPMVFFLIIYYTPNPSFSDLHSNFRCWCSQQAFLTSNFLYAYLLMARSRIGESDLQYSGFRTQSLKFVENCYIFSQIHATLPKKKFFVENFIFFQSKSCNTPQIFFFVLASQLKSLIGSAYFESPGTRIFFGPA